MEDICRLCCSSKFVSNNIFDEENALYLKMSLYLPIKVFKNDHLPQKVCDKCSCKVNDFYQFCNETIEVQNRLRSLVSSTAEAKELVDLRDVKDVTLPLHISRPAQCEQSTQTDEQDQVVKVKAEPKPPTPVPIKLEENSIESDHFFSNDILSDSSDDISLIKLKKRKKKVKLEVNGEKKKKKRKHKHLHNLLSSLSDIGIQNVKCEDGNNSNIEVKQEMVEVSEEDLGEILNNALKKKVKKEPNTAEEYNCCICFSVYYSRSEMLQHYKQHADAAELSRAPPAAPPPPDRAPLRCQRCSKVLDASTWAGHWARHWELDRRPYRCALCEKTFRDHHQILKHGMSHKATENDTSEPLQKRFLCDVCPEAFVYLRQMLGHRLRAHPECASRPLAFRCAAPHCARAFSHLNSLQRHARGHTGERNHLCNVCGKALSSREHLKFHIRIHTGYKPNVCQTCGKGFVKKCNLTLHERVHSGEKPHVCTHCGKAFSQRSTLVIHERYHSGSRPYVCELCGRGFVAKGLLSMHLKTTCI